MTKTKVQILGMGPLVPGLKLEDVVGVANSAQNSFEFSVGVPIETLGTADKDDGQYFFDSLENLLEENRRNDDVDVLVGVIDEQIDDELFSSINKECSCIIISVAGVDEILERSDKTYADYVLCETAAQLLALKYRKHSGIHADPKECEKPWHRQPKICLFDYDETRRHTYKKLMFPKLCKPCEALFEDANFPGPIKDDCVKLVEKGLKPWLSALRETVKSIWFLILTPVLLAGILFNADLGVPILVSSIVIGIIILTRFGLAYRNQFAKE